jgi:acetyl-CoA carboxylase carboxyl transferase subunit alpha
MFEDSIYSVLSPEGYASILWKDAHRVAEAAEQMRLTAQDLYEDGIIDRVVDEVNDVAKLQQLRQQIAEKITTLSALPAAERLAQRHARFRKF